MICHTDEFASTQYVHEKYCLLFLPLRLSSPGGSESVVSDPLSSRIDYSTPLKTAEFPLPLQTASQHPKVLTEPPTCFKIPPKCGQKMAPDPIFLEYRISWKLILAKSLLLGPNTPRTDQEIVRKADCQTWALNIYESTCRELFCMPFWSILGALCAPPPPAETPPNLLETPPPLLEPPLTPKVLPRLQYHVFYEGEMQKLEFYSRRVTKCTPQTSKIHPFRMHLLRVWVNFITPLE